MSSTTNTEQSNKRLLPRLMLIVVAMFAFGYALVPLYDVFCDITGLGGRTGQLGLVEAQARSIDESRWVTVEFMGVTSTGLPWEFKPLKNTVQVNPGAINEISYLARNMSIHSMVGQAIPSVSPMLASKYFNKTECFCFTQQTLAGKEERIMPVRFIIDPDLPQEVQTVTLSYSFFNADKYAKAIN